MHQQNTMQHGNAITLSVIFYFEVISIGVSLDGSGSGFSTLWTCDISLTAFIWHSYIA
jgi:hypothetical protein